MGLQKKLYEESLRKRVTIKESNSNEYINVYTDGATVGYNGKLGTVKEVGIGIWIPAFELRASIKLKGISNNEAEFMALILGMRTCNEIGIKRARFNMDSMIVKNRAQGNRPKKAKNRNERMDNFQDIVLDLATEEYFTQIEFKHIPRELNEKADELSKEATIKRDEAVDFIPLLENFKIPIKYDTQNGES